MIWSLITGRLRCPYCGQSGSFKDHSCWESLGKLGDGSVIVKCVKCGNGVRLGVMSSTPVTSDIIDEMTRIKEEYLSAVQPGEAGTEDVDESNDRSDDDSAGGLDYEEVGRTVYLNMPDVIEPLTCNFLVFVSGEAIKLLTPLWADADATPRSQEELRRWACEIQGVVVDGYFAGRKISDIPQMEHWHWASTPTFAALFPTYTLVRGDKLWNELEAVWREALAWLRETPEAYKLVDVYFDQVYPGYQHGARMYKVLPRLGTLPGFRHVMREVFMHGVAVACAEVKLYNTLVDRAKRGETPL